jgi:hypothetical protein
MPKNENATGEDECFLMLEELVDALMASRKPLDKRVLSCLSRSMVTLGHCSDRLWGKVRCRNDMGGNLLGVVSRPEDMSPSGGMTLMLQADGDVIVAVHDGEANESCVEYCTPMSGGGRSRHTLRALKLLALAMARDNEDTPIRRMPRDAT